MDEKYLEALEFDKIRARAADGIVCPEARGMLLGQPAWETPDEVRAALEQTDAMTTLLIKNGSPRFSSVENVRGIVQRAEKGGVLSMAELLTVADTLRNFRELVKWYGLTEHDVLPVDDLFYAMTPQPTLEKTIKDSILSENEMADTASDTLYDIRRKIHAAENSIRDKLDAITKSQSASRYLQDAVVSLRNGRFVVPVKAEHRGEVGGVIHDVSSSGSTLFVEPTAVVEANAKILQLRNLEQAEIERILAAFSARTAALEPMFTFGYGAMLELDVLLAKARLALDQKAMKPQVNDDHAFSLVRARHPLIDPAVVVPVDIALGGAYDTMVITGPNTGGKTVTLKTAGLLCAMAQHGYLIPAHESSSVCVFGEILVDIGDEQSIEQSLSTFSGHIKNITGILKLAGPQTLVLMDELGAGTDPAEGAALAVSVIEALRGLGAKIMATTHYSELKIFALDTPGVQNASCEFNVETLRPTYRLSVGVPGKSNAFLISQKLGLAPEIIENARAHLSNEDQQFDNILNQLEDLKVELKAQQDEVERLKHTASHALEQAEEKRAALIRQGEEELAAAREKAHGMVQDVQNTAYGLMDELRKRKRQAAQRVPARGPCAEIAKKETEKLFGKTDVVHAPQRTFKPLDSVKLGQEVLIAELDKPGIVTALPDKRRHGGGARGYYQDKVPLNGLCAPHKHSPRREKVSAAPCAASASSGDKVTRTPSMEINLIGMTVEEALHEADKFIDNGVMNGQTTLYLIHGKGTGALRKGIHEHLRRHKNVRSFRLGVYGEGEAGVTVVELK
ncbi:MAG: endonuclease MutS2 [Ruthenibacterium lactatiformans]